ncbi:carbohydrate kinase family protein [Sciscionella sediminilitoris]|uniref:carbohydrate kinase family protein n=1 Tax=Sciscionella sediminilitoris TaxID=1445613 RepID=UPI00068BFE68|nr:carbohydrate kinase family protein [Sciscionella sp. SE31]
MIVFCGYANNDVTVYLPALPGVGARVQARALHRRDGGMGANAAFAAARLGAEARFAGVLGADPLSAAFLEELGRAGVDTSWTARDGELTTAIVLVGPDGDRSIISQDDAITEAHLRQVLDRMSGGDLLYLDGYRFPWAAALVRAAPDVRLAVDLDGCEDADAARSALLAAEHVVLSAEQLALLGTEPGTAAVDHGTTVVVTEGARGWRLHAPDGQQWSGPALEVAVRDTTGAGDCFTGGYLAELERGSPAHEAARFAAAAASLSCTAEGARAGVPDRASLAEALSRTRRSR